MIKVIPQFDTISHVSTFRVFLSVYVSLGTFLGLLNLKDMEKLSRMYRLPTSTNTRSMTLTPVTISEKQKIGMGLIHRENTLLIFPMADSRRWVANQKQFMSEPILTMCFILESLFQVSYTVTKEGGYLAEVTYEGEAQYPPEPAEGYGKR